MHAIQSSYFRVDIAFEIDCILEILEFRPDGGNTRLIVYFRKSSAGTQALGRLWADFRRPLLWVAFPFLAGFLIFPWARRPDPPEPH